ncbi:MAG TPA: hypothetical protein VMT62_07435 [Syntrophorhabdaceae bacterium]|nr:hypothetical protein [Syntrophorhabdaceae bacterium]
MMESPDYQNMTTDQIRDQAIVFLKGLHERGDIKALCVTAFTYFINQQAEHEGIENLQKPAKQGAQRGLRLVKPQS